MPDIAPVILQGLRALEEDASWHLRCAVIMPDHVHLFMVLGERLSLGKCVARYKAKTAAALQQVTPRLTWARSFYDHRVRSDEDCLPLILYIYLNPYRAGLCPPAKSWPWFHCAEDDWP